MRNMKRLLALLLAALLICSNMPAALMEDNGLEIVYDDTPDADFDIEDGGEESPDVDAPVAELDDFELTADDAGDDGSEFDDGFETYDAFEEQVILEEEIACPDVDFDSEAAAAQFIDRAMSANRQGRVSFRAAYGTAGKSKLTGADANLYNVLKQLIQQVAEGERSDTHFVIEVRDIFDKLTYTAEDLGLETLYNSDGQLSNEALDAINAIRNFDTSKVITALLVDCPYDLYWYDKTVKSNWLPAGYRCSGETVQLCKSKSSTTGQIGPYFEFYVSKDYSVSGNTGTFEMDTAKASAVKSAAANAARIIERYSGAADMDKLTGYKNAICDLVSYNNTAANTSGYPYGDPWQLVWVFDGDASTNVVCEGYSKAFQYLCDMSQFTESITVISVTGDMRSSSGNGGLHMWNLVNMGGVNYMADLTNCDSGNVGYPDKLFMKGYSYKNSAGNYCFEVGSNTITYIFDNEKITKLFKAEDLAYTDDSVGPVTVGNSGTTGTVRWSMNSLGTLYISGSGAIPDYTDANPAPWAGSAVKQVSIASGVTAIGARAFYGCENLQQVTIPNSVTAIDETAFGACPNMFDVDQKGLIIFSCSNEAIREWAGSHAVNHSIYHGMTITDEAVEPTCGDTGLTRGNHCSICGQTITEQEIIPATGEHTWGEWATVKDATCVEAGSRTRGCINCEETETEVVLATGVHIWGAWTTTEAATCTQAGSEERECSVCHGKETQTIVATGVHIWGDWSITKEAGCTEAGSKARTCATCELTETEVVPATGHSWGEWDITKDAGCTEAGSEERECSVCHGKETQTIKATGHKAVAVKGYDATCTKEGLTEGSQCSVCKTWITPQKTIPMKGHKPVTVKGKAATCTATGLTDGTKCSVCGVTLTAQKAIAAVGHKPVTVKGKAATCTATGLTDGMKCSVCGEWITNQQTIAKTAHTPVTVKGKAATCTATGLTDGMKCSVCGEWITNQKTIAKTAHTPATVKGKAATCTATGLTDGTKCSACGTWIKAQQTIARKAHTPTTVKGYAATYVKAGLSDGTKCSACGTTLTAQKTIARKTYPGSVLAKKGKNGTITVNLGEQFLLTPAFATSAGLTVKGYKSSKAKVATVDKTTGLVKPLKEGKATITVTTNNKKKKATVVIKVVDPYKPTGISITNGKKVTLEMGKTLKLGTKLKPDTAQSNLTFKSSKNSVATVDGSGLVKPHKEGTAKITVTTRNKKKATITVKVVDPTKPTGISITNGKTVTLKAGQTLKLGTQLKPTTAQSELSWKSANKKIATVDATGTVKALKKGKVKITVTTKKNKKVKATITVKVEP